MSEDVQNYLKYVRISEFDFSDSCQNVNVTSEDIALFYSILNKIQSNLSINIHHYDFKGNIFIGWLLLGKFISNKDFKNGLFKITEKGIDLFKSICYMNEDFSNILRNNLTNKGY